MSPPSAIWMLYYHALPYCRLLLPLRADVRDWIIFAYPSGAEALSQ
jgi:hypothetical protein